MAARSSYVVTFYSYKGGVGRTTLLVNMAFELASRGHRIVVWDLDLEAPGLHEFPGLRPPERIWPSGFLEWMGEQDWTSEDAPGEEQLDQLLKYSYEPAVDEPVVDARPAYGTIRVLPAHGSRTNPASLYARIPWHRLLVEQPGGAARLFLAAVERITEKFEPTFLLIDSRTGLTDLGGLLTAIVPDCTVLVGSHGQQSTAGLRRVYAALQTLAGPGYAEAGRDRELDLMLVASPVLRGDVARSSASDSHLPFHLAVPFQPGLVGVEAVIVRDAPSSEAARAYREVAEELQRRREKLLRSRDAALLGAPAALAGTELRSARDQAESALRVMIERCRRLFGFLGFEVLPADDRAPGDFVARRVSTFHIDQFAVRCVAGELRADAFEALARWPSAQPRVVIADAVSGAVRPAPESGVTVRLLREVETEVIDLRAYAAMVRAAFEASPLARTYVRQRFGAAPSRYLDFAEYLARAHPAALDDSLPEEGRDALAEALAWARGEGDRLWFVLGDFGTGKTSFFRRFAYELAVRALDDPDAPVPIAIDLWRVSGAPSLELVLQQHLGATLHWHRDPGAILELLSAGRIVLLLDGFDEMGSVAYGATIGEQLEQMIRPSLAGGTDRRGNRILITCRKHFFRSDEQPLRAAAASSGRRRQVGLPGRISELALFNDAQIKEFLVARLGPEAAQATIALLSSTYGLRELAPRPMLLDMIAHTVGERPIATGRITVGLLYQEYVRDWLNRASQSAQTTPALRERLLERLAAQLWARPDNEIHYSALAELINRFEEDLAGLDATRVDLELRSAAFLVRSSQGEYRFSHRSFLEFFVARYLQHALQGGAKAFRGALDTADLTEPCAHFLADVVSAEPRDAAALAAGVTEILAAPYSSGVSENALRLAIGLRSTGQAAFAALPPPRARLEGAVLTGERLEGAQLEAANLQEAKLLGARLARANLVGASLRGAALAYSDLSDADLAGVNLSGSDLRHAALAGTRLRGANLTGADLRNSLATRSPDLRGAVLDGVHWQGAAWRVPELDRAPSAPDGGALPHWRVDDLVTPHRVRPRSRTAARCVAVAASRDSTHLLIAEGGSLASWRRLDDMMPELVFDVGAARITAVAVASDRPEVVLGCSDGAVVTRSVKDPGVDVRTPTGLSGIAELRPGERGLVAVSRRGGAVAIRGSRVEWLVPEAEDHPRACLALSEDGAWLVHASGPDVRWIGLADGKLVRRIRLEGEPVAVAVAGALGAVAVAERTAVTVHMLHGAPRSVAVDGEIRDVVWLGADLVIAREGGLAVWRELADQLDDLAGPWFGPAIFRCVDGDTLYVERQRSLTAVRRSGSEQDVLELTAPALAASFLDDRHLLVCIADRVEIWDLATLHELVSDVSAGQVVFDATVYTVSGEPGAQRVLATSDPVGGEIHALTLEPDVAELRSLDPPRPVPEAGVHQVAVSGDGRWRVAVGDGATLYDDRSESRIVRFWPDPAPAKQREAESGAAGVRDPHLVFGVAFHPTQPLFATAHNDHAVRIWAVPDVDRGVPALRATLPHPDSVHPVALGAAGALVTGCRDGVLRRWVGDPATSSVDRKGTLHHHRVGLRHSVRKRAWSVDREAALHHGEINGVAWSPDGGRIAAACDDGGVFVVDGGSLEVVASMVGHEAHVHTARWSPSGTRVVTASWDGTVRLWDAATGRQLAALDGRIGDGVWTAAGYATEVDDGVYLTDGRACVPAALYADRVIDRDRIIAAVAGTAIEPLEIDFDGAARRFAVAPAIAPRPAVPKRRPSRVQPKPRRRGLGRGRGA